MRLIGQYPRIFGLEPPLAPHNLLLQYVIFHIFLMTHWILHSPVFPVKVKVKVG